ncbi:MAG TPA: primosomal replication protein N [Quisquiliibacterium sp.]|nr:primosomal replication protein N [Quisquiliibacterium sp.]
MTANRVELQGRLAAREALRFSPAGIPILSASLQHESGQQEAGSQRKVELEIAVVFAGRLAESADRIALGAGLQVRGFLAPRRRSSKQLVLHVTEFELIEV